MHPLSPDFNPKSIISFFPVKFDYTIVCMALLVSLKLSTIKDMSSWQLIILITAREERTFG